MKKSISLIVIAGILGFTGTGICDTIYVATYTIVNTSDQQVVMGPFNSPNATIKGTDKILPGQTGTLTMTTGWSTDGDFQYGYGNTVYQNQTDYCHVDYKVTIAPGGYSATYTQGYQNASPSKTFHCTVTGSNGTYTMNICKPGVTCLD